MDIQLIRIGYDKLEGYVVGGMDAWQAEGRPVRSYPTGSVDDLCHAYLAGKPLQVFDVGQPVEFQSGHVPGSLNRFVGDLPQRLHDVPQGSELWVACASGYRAAIAASLLDHAGSPVRLVAQGGVPEWLARCFPQQRSN